MSKLEYPSNRAIWGAEGAALEGAVRSLERTCTIDDRHRFRRLRAGLRDRAARDGVPELLAPGRRQVAALGSGDVASGCGPCPCPRLDAVPETRPGISLAAGAVREALAEDRHAGFGWLAREIVRAGRETGAPSFRQLRYGEAGLSRERRQAVERWLAYDREHERLAADVRAWPGRPEALIDERSGVPVWLVAVTDWRDHAAALLDEAAAMRALDGPHAPHLAAMPDTGAALATARARLDDTLVAVGMREIGALEAAARRHAARARPRSRRARACPPARGRGSALSSPAKRAGAQTTSASPRSSMPPPRASARTRSALLLERIARDRDEAGELGIAEFDTTDWPAIAADARALLDAGTLPVTDRTELEHALAREAAHHAGEPEIPSPRHDPGIRF